MLKHIIDFYKVSAPAPCNGDSLPEQKQRLKRLQWSTFLAATLGYSMYYVCRLSLNVVKKPIVDEGIFSETELGIIGSVLFFTYAIGKFSNGFLADRSNINRFMSTGLLVTALINLCLGFTNSFILFAEIKKACDANGVIFGVDIESFKECWCPRITMRTKPWTELEEQLRVAGMFTDHITNFSWATFKPGTDTYEGYKKYLEGK